MNRVRAVLASRHLGLVVVLLCLFVGFGVASEPFRDPVNLLDRMRLWTEVGLVAVPMTFLIAAAGIDLSVGSLVTLSAIVGAMVARDLHWPFPVALFTTLLVGLIGGAANGLVVSALRVPPLVATLASLAIFRGIALGLSHGQPIGGFPSAFGTWGSLATIGSGTYALPQQFLLLLLAVGLGELILRKTRAGRWTLQLGENETAARYAAMPVDRVRFGLFLASGLMCGLAAITYMARFATAHPADHAGLELQAIACVVIGGTRITGGGGSVVGTFLGLLVLAILGFGLEMVGVVQQVQTIIVGLLVVTIAIFNEWIAGRRGRRKPVLATGS